MQHLLLQQLCCWLHSSFITVSVKHMWYLVILWQINWDGMELLYAHGLPVDRKTAARLGLETMKTGKLSHSAMCILSCVFIWRLGCWINIFWDILITKNNTDGKILFVCMEFGRYCNRCTYYYTRIVRIPHALILASYLILPSLILADITLTRKCLNFSTPLSLLSKFILI